jgi:hypothetical protein
MFRIWSRFAYLFVSRALKEKALKAKQFKEANRQKARCRSASPLRAWCNFSICFFLQSPKAGISPKGGKQLQKGKGFGKVRIFSFNKFGF